MGTGVLFFDDKGRVLVVKPGYKDHWTVPGGVSDKNESPRQTGEREVKEEIGLEVKLKQLVAVSYNFDRGDGDENLQWWFYGGVLSNGQIKQIRVDGEEILEYKFVEPEEAERLGRKNLTNLIPVIKKAIETKMAVYLENWEEVENE
jgi:8-oxo-dGTP pyrophosphatase MutT (NUDIX family)